VTLFPLKVTLTGLPGMDSQQIQDNHRVQNPCINTFAEFVGYVSKVVSHLMPLLLFFGLFGIRIHVYFSV
jgi:hypothetical protein